MIILFRTAAVVVHALYPGFFFFGGGVLCTGDIFSLRYVSKALKVWGFFF